MDSSLKTQLDIKNNAEDIQRFYSEIKTWEKEIKEKEEKLTGETTLQTEVRILEPLVNFLGTFYVAQLLPFTYKMLPNH